MVCLQIAVEDLETHYQYQQYSTACIDVYSLAHIKPTTSTSTAQPVSAPVSVLASPSLSGDAGARSLALPVLHPLTTLHNPLSAQAASSGLVLEEKSRVQVNPDNFQPQQTILDPLFMLPNDLLTLQRILRDYLTSLSPAAVAAQMQQGQTTITVTPAQTPSSTTATSTTSSSSTELQSLQPPKLISTGSDFTIEQLLNQSPAHTPTPSDFALSATSFYARAALASANSPVTFAKSQTPTQQTQQQQQTQPSPPKGPTAASLISSLFARVRSGSRGSRGSGSRSRSGSQSGSGSAKGSPALAASNGAASDAADAADKESGIAMVPLSLGPAATTIESKHSQLPKSGNADGQRADEATHAVELQITVDDHGVALVDIELCAKDPTDTTTAKETNTSEHARAHELAERQSQLPTAAPLATATSTTEPTTTGTTSATSTIESKTTDKPDKGDKPETALYVLPVLPFASLTSPVFAAVIARLSAQVCFCRFRLS